MPKSIKDIILMQSSLVYGDSNIFQSDSNFQASQTNLRRCSDIQEPDHFPIYDITRLGLKKNLEIIRDKLQIITLRYDDIQKMFNRLSVVILILSAIITLVNATQLLIIQYVADENINTPNKNIINLFGNTISLFMGTVLTILTSIIRFKNYRERMEKLKDIQEKLIILRSELSKDLTLLNTTDKNEEIIIQSIKERLIDYNKRINAINIMQEVSSTNIIKYMKIIASYYNEKDTIQQNNQRRR